MSRNGLLAALAALCTGSSVHAGDLTIEIQGNCPGVLVLRWSGATPSHLAGLWFSHNLGQFTLPAGPCGGTVLGLGTNGLRLDRTFHTSPDGEGYMRGRVTEYACGGYVQMMVQDGNPCATSDVLQLP